MKEWLHVQHDVYPAYISWAQYQANQERLRQNSANFAPAGPNTPGAAREGEALLQGLAVCGFCGCRMHVLYQHTTRYVCKILQSRGEPACQWVRAPVVDAVVTQAFFQALAPAQLDALEATLAAQQAEQARLERQWTEQLKRVRYEAQLAERQYNAVDPDNRLVAAELERRWENKLQQLQEVQEAHERFQRKMVRFELSPEQRRQFQHLSETLPDLWPKLPNAHKKDLLRTLIAQVILRRDPPDQVEIRVVWVSGHFTRLSAQLPIHRREKTTGYADLVRRIQELWQAGASDEEAAAQLTAEGFHSARRTQVQPRTVANIRRENGWQLPLAQHRNALEIDGQLTTRGLAAQLGTTRNRVAQWVFAGKIEARYVSHHPQSKVVLIQNDPDLIELLRGFVPQISPT
jgi:hypothetical protein